MVKLKNASYNLYYQKERKYAHYLFMNLKQYTNQLRSYTSKQDETINYKKPMSNFTFN